MNSLTDDELKDLTDLLNDRFGEFGPDTFELLNLGEVRLIYGAIEEWQWRREYGAPEQVDPPKDTAPKVIGVHLNTRVDVAEAADPVEPPVPPKRMPSVEPFALLEHANGHHPTRSEEEQAEIDALAMGSHEKAAKLRETIYALQDMSVDGAMPTRAEWDENRPRGQPTSDGVAKRHQLTWNQLAEYARLKPNSTGRRKVHSQTD